MMLNRKNVLKGLRQPELALVLLRRSFPWAALRNDSECFHIVQAWSSGHLQRVAFADKFPEAAAYSVQVRKPSARVIGWSLDLTELVHILTVIKLINARRVLEIGTFDGFTALNFAANVEVNGGEVVTVDLPQGQDQEALRAGGISNAITSGVVGTMFRDEPEAARIRQVWGDSAVMDWGALGGPFDIIFIDGSHDYKYVLSDSLNAINCIRPGGVIFWHDYGQAVDVSRAVDQLRKDHPIVAIRGTRLACLATPGMSQPLAGGPRPRSSLLH
jgi:predicted O-methyltransferase YrrM